MFLFVKSVLTPQIIVVKPQYRDCSQVAQTTRNRACRNIRRRWEEERNGRPSPDWNVRSSFALRQEAIITLGSLESLMSITLAV